MSGYWLDIQTVEGKGISAKIRVKEGKALSIYRYTLVYRHLSIVSTVQVTQGDSRSPVRTPT